MRLRISHDTRYVYESPARSVIQTVRLTPRNHDGQFVIHWRLDVSEDCRLDEQNDAFGNISHTFSVSGSVSELRVRVEGEVETQDTSGVVRGAIEWFPPSLFLRPTMLTQPDDAIIAFAAKAKASSTSVLDALHALLRELLTTMTFDVSPTQTGTTASQSFALRRGVCQDIAHIFIAAARSLGIPARYIGGHFFRADGAIYQEAGHAWAEAFVPDLGWVAFDPTNGISATDAYVRVAVGLDYLGAAPIRGARTGGHGETMSVAVHVDQSARQSQS